LARIIWNLFLHIIEGTSFNENVLVFINLGILVINLDFVEGLILDSFGLDDESSLSNASNFSYSILIVVIIIDIVMLSWERWFRNSNHFQRLEFSIFTYRYKSPIVKTAFPELSKINFNLFLCCSLSFNVTFLDFMPGQHMLIWSLYWWRCSKSKEDLWIFLLDAPLNNGLNDEMHSNTSNYRLKSFLKLPVNSIIEHVEQNHCLIPNRNVAISLKLNEKLLDPLQPFFIICNLGNEQCSLDFFKILHFLGNLSLSKLNDVFLVHLLVEWEFLNVDNDFRKSSRQPNKPFHEGVVFLIEYLEILCWFFLTFRGIFI